MKSTECLENARCMWLYFGGQIQTPHHESSEHPRIEHTKNCEILAYFKSTLKGHTRRLEFSNHSRSMSMTTGAQRLRASRRTVKRFLCCVALRRCMDYGPNFRSDRAGLHPSNFWWLYVHVLVYGHFVPSHSSRLYQCVAESCYTFDSIQLHQWLLLLSLAKL